MERTTHEKIRADKSTQETESVIKTLQFTLRINRYLLSRSSLDIGCSQVLNNGLCIIASRGVVTVVQNTVEGSEGLSRFIYGPAA